MKLLSYGLHFLFGARLGSRRPQGIEIVSEGGSPNDEHTLVIGARPPHARASQTRLELFDATLDRAGANRIGSGIRWSPPAAEQMLVIRAAVLDHSFDALWLAAA